MTLYSAPFKAPKSLLGELLAPVDVFVDLFKLVNIDIGFTLSDDLKKEYGTGAKAIFIDMAVSLFKPATLFFIFLALAVVAWQPLIRPAIANNLPNPAPVSNPVIVPPLSWPATPTMTPSPTATTTPTSTLTPTPTPIVFASEGECDPIPVDPKESMATSVALTNHLEAVYGLLGDGQSTVPFAYFNDERDWWTLGTWTSGTVGTGAFVLPQAEWEGTLKLPSNRYCMVEGQWYPLPPLPDGTRLVK